MDISNIVERIKSETYTLYGGEVKRDPFVDPDEEMTQKALVKICESWNKSEGSRKFIKHLIGSFMTPGAGEVEQFTEDDKTNGINRCCILGIRVAGTEEIKETWQKAMEVAGESEKKFYWLTRKFPVEIKNGTAAWSTEKSSKILSREAYTALKHFVDVCKSEGEKEIIEIFKPRQKNKKKKSGNNFHKAEKLSGNSLGSLFSDEIWKKLKGVANN